MKKIAIAIIATILVAAGTVAILYFLRDNYDESSNNGNGNQTVLTDAQRFVEEHERFNNTLRDNGEPHLNITIPADNTVVYVTFDELMELMNYGTGVFFFGIPSCPSCRPIFPGFLQIAIDMGIPLHYYYYMREDREAHNERYVALLDRLRSYLPVNDRDQTPGEPGFDPEMKRISVPHIFVVRDGVIVAHAMLNRHPYLATNNLDGIYAIIRDVLSHAVSSTCTPTDDC